MMQPTKQMENEEISTEEPAEEEANPHTDTRRRWEEETLIEQPEHGRNETDGSRNPDIGPVTRHRFPLRQKHQSDIKEGIKSVIHVYRTISI